MEIVVASHNPGKVAELKKLLEHLSVTVFSLDDFDNIPEVAEDEATYEKNAIKKARAIYEATGKIALADDSGLEVDALQGDPGVRSARFGGEGLTDHERNMKLLEQLREVPDDDRGATFQCRLAIVGPKGLEKVVSGSCRGTIIQSPRGGSGFGYDPIFLPFEYSHTFAELSPEIKNKISHRGRALEKAALFLDGYLYSRMQK
ncbi:MAG: XTP/dITP diphosphatase [Candidatus Euphemobacter frigidus]|nr:XTP/dITP diphosphatase [Candidatus Euphemobacter frigidus]